MSTTSNSRLGPNSMVLSYSAGCTQTDFLNAMNDLLAAQGWSLYDALAGANARCYRAPIADGTMAYKYIVVDVNTSNLLLCKVYEGWNAGSHIGNNLCYTSDSTGYGQGMSLNTGGAMFVFANVRYAIFFGKTSALSFGAPGIGGGFTGCVEISRDNQDEVPGNIPCFGWVNSSIMLGYMNTGYTTLYYMSLPRTRLNSTASGASVYQSIGTIMGRGCSDFNTGYFVRLYMQLPTANNPLSNASANNFVFTPYSIDNVSNANIVAGKHVRGRLYGIKILALGLGSLFDSVDIKTDSNLFFDPLSSTVKTHAIITEVQYQGRFALPL